jgi:LacI family transcriptional regulator
LARAAGVSPSTVSIVMGGKSEERKIPMITQTKVLTAARELGYRSNVAAKRLRTQMTESLEIAVFWASDFRAPMMVRFLRGLQEEILDSKKRCEIVIHTYQNNMLKESILALGIYNAAIICNASADDLDFLEQNKFHVPIVLYNRHSDKFCTVNVDDNRMGTLPAEIFVAREHSRAVILTSDSYFPGMDIRVESFLRTATGAGIQVQQVHQENSMAGGYEGGKRICNLQPFPDCIFSMSDAMSIGALRAFSEAGLHVPENLELISIGNGDREIEEYASTSISVVHLPMEDMAKACFRMTQELLSGSIEPPYSVELPIVYRARESCGDFPDRQ